MNLRAHAMRTKALNQEQHKIHTAITSKEATPVVHDETVRFSQATRLS